MSQELLTPKELAARWSLNPNTLSQWRWNGKGPHYIKVGGHILYRLSDIELFEEEKRRSHTAETMEDRYDERKNLKKEALL